MFDCSKRIVRNCPSNRDHFSFFDVVVMWVFSLLVLDDHHECSNELIRKNYFRKDQIVVCHDLEEQQVHEIAEFSLVVVVVVSLVRK